MFLFGCLSFLFFDVWLLCLMLVWGIRSSTSLFHFKENVDCNTLEKGIKSTCIRDSFDHSLRARNHVQMPQALFKQNVYYLWRCAVNWTILHTHVTVMDNTLILVIGKNFLLSLFSSYLFTATSTFTQLWGLNVKQLLCCLMSSDVGWHFKDKLRPVREHGSVLLYVHRNHQAR